MWIFNVDYIAVFLLIDSTLSFKCFTASHMTSFCLSHIDGQYTLLPHVTSSSVFFCQERFEMRIG